MAWSIAPWQNPRVFGCPHCTALKADYIDRITAFIELCKRRNGQPTDPQLEQAIRRAQAAIDEAWTELSTHRELHGPAQVAS